VSLKHVINLIMSIRDTGCHTKHFVIRTAHGEPCWTHVSTGALTRKAMGYGAMGHVVTQEPISEARRGLESQNA
jgi:hypothetical protein